MKSIRPSIFHRDEPASPNATLYREATIERAAVDADARTVELSFSSETAVMRYGEEEILDHSPGSIRLDRLANGGALLLNHDRGQQIGVVERVWLDEKDRRGRARVRFGKGKLASEIFDDVRDGIRQLVSVGYRVNKWETTEGENGKVTVRALDWEPFEVSIVSVPADVQVGVGRCEAPHPPALTQTNPQTKPNNFSTPTTMKDRIISRLRALNIQFDETASVDTLRGLLPEAERSAYQEAPPSNPPAPAPAHIQVGAENDSRQAVAQERQRISAIQTIAGQIRAQGANVDAERAIQDGTSLDDFREHALAALCSRRSTFQPEWSPSERRDAERFDFGRALRSLMSNRPLDGIEAEICDEGAREAREAGVSNSGAIMLPRAFVRSGMTATGETTVAGDQGGMTIETAKGGLLDDFFNASVMRDLGATVLEGLTGNLDMPRLIAGSDPAGKAENAAADDANATTGQLQLRPKRLPAFIDVSDQLLNQSSSAIEALLRRHLANQLLAVQERAFFHGGGTNEAAGIAGTTGIGAVVGGTNGAAPTWAHIISLEEKVDAQNAMDGMLAYVSNGQIRAKLKSTPKQSSGVEANFILSDLSPNVVNGHRAAFTNAVRRNLTKGNQDGTASAIFFGNFADYVLAYWGGIALDVVRDAAGAKKGERSLVANIYYDGGVLRPKSFAAMLDALGA